MDYNGIRVWAQELAIESGRRAVEMVKEKRQIEKKSDGSLVTEVDRAIEVFIREQIGQKFPTHAILGEEFGMAAVANTDAPLWAIDPIDGTTNLASNIPLWGVSIGLIDNGEPVVGALSFPLIGEVYSGASGAGAFYNEQPLASLGEGRPLENEDPYSICTTCVKIWDFAKLPAKLRLFGSSALDICWTAAGRTHGAQSVGVALWDVAAAGCIAREVGCELAWLVDKTPWSALEMAREGKRKTDAFASAPPKTLAWVRERLL
jgi:fructose-1,6-bisphosphatase/inositol monophosphatase family enzyme